MPVMDLKKREPSRDFPGKASHRQLKKLQALMEEQTGQRFTFLQLARGCIAQAMKGLYMGSIVDANHLHRIAVETRKAQGRHDDDEPGERIEKPRGLEDHPRNHRKEETTSPTGVGGGVGGQSQAQGTAEAQPEESHQGRDQRLAEGETQGQRDEEIAKEAQAMALRILSGKDSGCLVGGDV